MKKIFAEYYELSEERIKDIWDNSLIVFDTNVLLNLYRYEANVQEDFINVMKFYKERLWIPYQVGLEFHRNRIDILRNNKNAYKSLKESLEKDLLKAVDSLCSNGNYARHPYIDMEGIRKKVKGCIASISKSLDKQESAHPDYMQTDTILNTITELFEGRVGSDFKSTELETLYKEGEKRYANQMPPGYCDEKKKKNEQKRKLYGDLIVWKQTIRHSETEKRDVIFVTDDYKDDWWDKVEGKHSPRKELIKEFIENTGQDILIYNSVRFLEYAKPNKELKIRQKSIDSLTKIVEEETRKLAKIREVTQGMDVWRSRMESFREQYRGISEMNETLSRLSSIPSAIDISKYFPNQSVLNIPPLLGGLSQDVIDSIDASLPSIKTEQIVNDASTE